MKQWVAFWFLGLIWGSSFLWIKVAVRELGPVTLVAFRFLFALGGLLALMRLQRIAFPRNHRLLLALLFMGVFNTAIPFVLISAGEVQVDSGVAAVLNATMPLFTIIVAHFWLHDEKITRVRILGLVIGFVGIIILFVRNLSSLISLGNLWGQFFMLVAASLQATAAVFARKYLRDQPPLLQAAMIILIADSILWLVVPLTEFPVHIPVEPITWLAIGWLGIFGSCVAYILYFYLIASWGATRASLVNYVFPVVGPILGILFLGEVADLRLIVGSLCILASTFIISPFLQLRRASLFLS